MTIHSPGTLDQPIIGQAIFEFEPEQKYIAQTIAPILPSDTKAGKLLKVLRAGTLPGKNDSLSVANGAAYSRTGMGTGLQDFSADKTGEEFPITEEDEALYSNYFDALTDAGRVLRNNLLADRERKIASLFYDTDVFTAGKKNFKDNKAAPWSVAGTSIIAQVGAAILAVTQNTGMKPNTLIISSLQLHYMQYLNTEIMGRLINIMIPTPEAILMHLAAIFGIARVVVGDGIQNSANEGVDAIIEDIWTSNYAMVARCAVTASPKEDCIARIPVWTELADSDVRISTYVEDQTDSTIVKGKLFEDHLIVDDLAGMLMQVEIIA